jgi:flavin reductase (DIM6/NTAB) family NADH-FMN oxidoreductase RutF
MRIFTGAPIPEGADAVLMVERTTRLDGGEHVALGAEVALVRLRLELAPHLGELPPPLGFGRRPARRRPSPTTFQQESGPDPPAGTR